MFTGIIAMEIAGTIIRNLKPRANILFQFCLDAETD